MSQPMIKSFLIIWPLTRTHTHTPKSDREPRVLSVHSYTMYINVRMYMYNIMCAIVYTTLKQQKKLTPKPPPRFRPISVSMATKTLHPPPFWMSLYDLLSVYPTSRFTICATRCFILEMIILSLKKGKS